MCRLPSYAAPHLRPTFQLIFQSVDKYQLLTSVIAISEGPVTLVEDIDGLCRRPTLKWRSEGAGEGEALKDCLEVEREGNQKC